jgi:subtilisin family serine protease/subtilisin-like proprotein convertase family protein
MTSPIRPTRPLRVERLEDRCTPAAATTPRVLVTFADPAADGTAELRTAAPTDSVTPLGFGVYRVDLPAGADAAAAADGFARLPGVEAAEPDRVVRVEAVPNDPQFPAQYALQKISAPAAWDRGYGNRRTVVAVIDSGVDYTHPDLAANVWTNLGEVPGDGIDNDGDGYVDDVHGWDFANDDNNPMDDNGHGTHVAGIIGATGNNGTGVSGVAQLTQIMPLKFMAADGGGLTSDAVSAINYAVARGARVINASWGGSDTDPALQAAIGRASAAGVIFVTAAGNSGANNNTAAFYPANYVRTAANVVTVAATDANDALAGFSNRGSATVTLAAPGVNVLSTLPGGGYGTKSGTSMAAPMVSGAVAVLWDQNPTWTAAQVLAKLKASVDPLPGLAGQTITGGRLDLAKMLDASPAASPTSPPAATGVARVAAGAFSGDAGTVSRVRFTYTGPTTAAAVASGLTVTGPGGAIPVLAVAAVPGTNNTQFDATFATQTLVGVYAATAGGFTTQGRIWVPPPLTLAFYRTPTAVPDQGSVRVPLVIDQNLTVADVDARVILDHTYDADVTITLTAPDGATVTLVTGRGGAGDGFTDTGFDDAAGGPIAYGTAPFAYTYRPEQPLAAFNGHAARGTWWLTVTDAGAGDTGTLRAVSLGIVGSPAARAASTEVTTATASVTESGAAWFARPDLPLTGDGLPAAGRPAERVGTDSRGESATRAETRALLGEDVSPTPVASVAAADWFTADGWDDAGDWR